MTVNELEEIWFLTLDISDIIVPFSKVVNKSKKGVKYRKLSNIPIEKQREDYKLVLKQELI